MSATVVNAQSSMGFDPSDAYVPGFGSPAHYTDAELQQRMQAHRVRGKELQQELRIIRSKYFRNVRNVQIRQAGIDKLKTYVDPASFDAMLEVFQSDGDDVRTAIVDHLADLKTDEALATLAWTAVFDENEDIAKLAFDKLNAVTTKLERIPYSVQTVIAQGLGSEKSAAQGVAAKMAADMSLYEAIPMMINAQVNPGNTGGGGGGGTGTGALAQILIGTQVAYVSDLEPVVGDSAVGFDPELSVATEGVYLRVSGVAVSFYNVDVHNALRRITSAGWGADSTRQLGWNIPAWHEWKEREYDPRVTELVQSEHERRAAITSPTNPTDATGRNSDAVIVPNVLPHDLDVPVAPAQSGPGGG
ncbi:MAG: HEAT repeat domain-containing protein [Phycisphaeraceae bacterium]|nr:HEAT repeat domain-containing protein [Phycisphaerales bacterium]MCB9861480.1 HEAT repeat domain-containing protein [Phycisphaeraceae bacterium]